jgi:predicted N-acetyltransferase YhbS
MDAERRVADVARIKAFRDVQSKAKKAWFDEKFGSRQLWLTTLAVHPEYQRYGIGAAIVNWGVELAESERVPIALFATPLGKKLYLKFGFEDVGSERVQVDGEDEWLMLEGMVREVR